MSSECHACHTKWASMSPVAKCHTCHTNSDHGVKREPSASATSATPATGREGRCHQMPRLKHKVKVEPNPTPATQNGRRCHQVTRLPRQMTLDAAKCHAYHTNCRGDQGVKREPSAPEPAQGHKCHACHAK